MYSILLIFSFSSLLVGDIFLLCFNPGSIGVVTGFIFSWFELRLWYLNFSYKILFRGIVFLPNPWALNTLTVVPWSFLFSLNHLMPQLYHRHTLSQLYDFSLPRLCKYTGRKYCLTILLLRVFHEIFYTIASLLTKSIDRFLQETGLSFFVNLFSNFKIAFW